MTRHSVALVATVALLSTLVAAAPTAASAAKSWAFSLDCNSSGDKPSDDSAQTSDPLTVEFYSGGDYVGYTEITPDKHPVDTGFGNDFFQNGCSSTIDLGFIVHLGIDTEVDEVKIYIDGDDALWIDESFLWKSSNDTADYDDDWSKVEHWGRDNSNGWCLSDEEDDWQGNNYKGHVPADACSGCIKFSVSDGGTYFCSGDPHHTNED